MEKDSTATQSGKTRGTQTFGGHLHSHTKTRRRVRHMLGPRDWVYDPVGYYLFFLYKYLNSETAQNSSLMDQVSEACWPASLTFILLSTGKFGAVLSGLPGACQVHVGLAPSGAYSWSLDPSPGSAWDLTEASKCHGVCYPQKNTIDSINYN